MALLPAEELAIVRGLRWVVVGTALGLAGAALYLLLGTSEPSLPEREQPAMDAIDDESREAMRDLLRQVEED